MRLFFFLTGILAALTACNAVESPPRADYLPRASSIAAGSRVTVQRGDTVYSLARRHNVSMRELIAINNLQSPFYLTPGTYLTLPSARPPVPEIPEDSPPPSISSMASRSSGTPVSIAPQPPVITPWEGDPLKSGGGVVYSQKAPEAPDAALEAMAVAASDTGDQIIYAPVSRGYGKKPSTPEPVPARPLAEEALPPIAPQPGRKAPLTRELGLKPLKYDARKKQLKPSTLPPKPVDLPEIRPPESVKQVETKKFPGEEKKNKAVRKQASFIWPVQGPVLSGYGPKPNGLRNDGMNIGAPRGTPVVAADGGTVAYAGSDIPGFGNVVLIRHASGLMTTYAHLDRMFVQRDAIVASGDTLGSVGTSGGLDTPQLHFEIRQGKEALDPGKYLSH